MSKLYYGNGVCSVEGNVGSLSILYKGAILIDSKLPYGYTISLDKKRIYIEPFLNRAVLGELFGYIGEFRIISITAHNDAGVPISVPVYKSMDFSELLDTKAEDMTRKSEDIKVGYLHITKLQRTRVQKKVYESLHTSSTNKNLFLNGELYKGNFHIHIDGTAMTGMKHSEDSRALEIR